MEIEATPHHSIFRPPIKSSIRTRPTLLDCPQSFLVTVVLMMVMIKDHEGGERERAQWLWRRGKPRVMAPLFLVLCSGLKIEKKEKDQGTGNSRGAMNDGGVRDNPPWP